MSAIGSGAEAICLKCAAPVNWLECRACGLKIKTDPIIALGKAPIIDPRSLNYAEWMKSKNIYVWIKNKR